MLITFDWFIFTKNGLYHMTPDANTHPMVYNMLVNFCGWSSEEPMVAVWFMIKQSKRLRGWLGTG